MSPLDEVILISVRENKFVYDRADKNFKNTAKRKGVWKNISDNLKSSYDINVTAEGVEKRWYSLRDMFSRECRKEKVSSRSGYKRRKQWRFYKNMQFLAPYVFSRRTKLSQSTVDADQTSNSNETSDNNNLELSNDQSDIIQSSSTLVDQDNNEHDELAAEDMGVTLGEIAVKPEEAILPDSNCSINLNSQMFSNSTLFNSIDEMSPDLGSFSKQQKSDENEDLGKKFEKMLTSISTIMNSVKSLVQEQNNYKVCGYISAIDEGLSHVPTKNRTQCFIEVLQVIQKYEKRE